MKSSFVTFAALLATSYLVSTEAVILEVPGYGVLNGTIENSSFTERLFYAFRSVFYAEKPTPENRFLPPIPKAPYPTDELQQAVANNLGCPQNLPGDEDEDCLSLNVFTPTLPPDSGKLLPVLVWIHGGAFSLGHAVEYVPNRYMEHDIVFVVVQYRLGPLGFLSFDTDDVPGNAGIFDQIEALRWVQKNIKYFGGDQNQVTIGGVSAGSASVSLLLLAPQARGLFHRAIGESGSVLAEWALDRNGQGRVASLRIAEIAGCPLKPYEDLLNCVRNVDAGELTRAYGQYMSEEMLNGGLGFSGSNPVIQVAGAQRIIETDPKELYSNGNFSTVPTLFGANKQEGVIVVGVIYNKFLVPNNLTEDEEFLANDAVPTILEALRIPDPTGQIAANMTQTYLGGAEMGNLTSMTPGMVDMCGVLFLKEPTYQVSQFASRYNRNSYFYSFEYEGRNSLFIYMFAGKYPPVSHGVNHGDEMIYFFVFPFPSIPSGLNASETELSMKLLQVWTNFVIHGNPTPDGAALLDGIPQFLPYSENDENYMAIDEVWNVKKDFKQTYTITVDELNPAFSQTRASKTSKALSTSNSFE